MRSVHSSAFDHRACTGTRVGEFCAASLFFGWLYDTEAWRERARAGPSGKQAPRQIDL
jgi:hypothetical protein